MESTITDKKVFESLEKDVALLNTMFTDLQDMVKEQGEKLDSLEDSIVTTKSDVSTANKEIVVANHFSRGLATIRSGIIGIGVGSLVYLYNPYLAIGSMLVGGYIGLSLS
jgi:t-SNARE complex subunit (syntaxin)